MTRKNTIIVSTLLIISAIVLEIISEHFGFIAGFLFGAGISILINSLFFKKKQE